MFTVDGHLDLAYCALKFGRNLQNTVAEIRASEKTPSPNGIATVSIPELIAGDVGIVLGSLYAMPRSRTRVPVPGSFYEDGAPPKIRQAGAHKVCQAHLDLYHRWADEDDRVVLVQSWSDVERVQAAHGGENPLLGIVAHMEGADAIQDPAEVDMWYERGLRSIGFAWDDTRYSPGQWNEAGKLPKDGYALLERMANLNMLLDITHASEAATFNMFDAYEGTIVATHCNTRTLVDQKRQITDEQIRHIAEHNGLVGIVLFNIFLRQGHSMGDAKELVALDHAVAHIDHICQMLGSADYVGIGSDWDGGFGSADIPHPFDTAADLPQLATALTNYGYDEESVAKIMGGNWLRVLQQILP